MNHPDYETLMRHAGAHPAQHPAQPAHPSHALAVHSDPHAPAPHTVHVVHDARPPAATAAPHGYAPPAEVHHHYPPPHGHALEHDRHPDDYPPHRARHHERDARDHDRHHEDLDERDGRSRDRDRRRWPHPKHQTTADDIRMFPIGFVMLAIAAGDTEDIEVKPQVRFQGRRLAVAQSIARYFDIVDIKVGKDSQLAATGALSGEALSALAVDVRVELDPAPPGIVITLSVKNNDTVAHDFRAVLYGLVEEVDD